MRLGIFGENLDGFSGIPRHIITTMRALGVDVVEMSPAPYRPTYSKRAHQRIRRFFGGNYLWEKAPERCNYLSRSLDRAVASEGVDAVLMFGSEACAFSETNVPLYVYADSIFGTRVDFYADQVSSRMDSRSIREGIEMQQRALEKLRIVFLSSRWAWDRAIARFGYDVSSEKCEVVLIGANLPYVDAPLPTPPTLRFSWIGGDWHRKQGDFAVSVVRAIRSRAIPAEIEIAGNVSVQIAEPWIHVLGRIDGISAHRELHSRCAAMLLPTIADLTPVAIAEAAAFGRPTVAAGVGGIPEMIRNRESGIILSSDDPEEWADVILSSDLYNCGQHARKLYETKLNWPTICRGILQRIGG